MTKVFGSGLSEYEFVRTVDPPGVRRLADALGADDTSGLRTAIENRFVGAGGSRALQQYLEDIGVLSAFWNRIGD